MFTGIVTDIGTVVEASAAGTGRRFTIACHYPLETLVIGASIATAGICLTVTARAGGADGTSLFSVDASPETLARTTAGRWEPGRRVNLERPLRIGDELGGHMVTGHVDGVATLTDRQADAGTARLSFTAPDSLLPFIAQKGSVALDGCSLTVNGVSGDGFWITLIPHTLSVTTFSSLAVAESVNLEVDLLARYAARLAQSGVAG